MIKNIRFGIDANLLSEDEFSELILSLNLIEELSKATLTWGDPQGTTVYMEYAFKTVTNQQGAYSMMKDLNIDFPAETTLEEF
jgi:hypothetical protein